MCDLVKNCVDGSDEWHCDNGFQCNFSRNYIPIIKKCDGVIDCLDASDECNEHCSKDILEETYIKIFSWIIGFSAIVTNTLTAVITGKSMRKCRTAVALVNKLFVLCIGFGDFLTGKITL